MCSDYNRYLKYLYSIIPLSTGAISGRITRVCFVFEIFIFIQKPLGRAADPIATTSTVGSPRISRLPDSRPVKARAVEQLPAPPWSSPPVSGSSAGGHLEHGHGARVAAELHHVSGTLRFSAKSYVSATNPEPVRPAFGFTFVFFMVAFSYRISIATPSFFGLRVPIDCVVFTVELAHTRRSLARCSTRHRSACMANNRAASVRSIGAAVSGCARCATGMRGRHRGPRPAGKPVLRSTAPREACRTYQRRLPLRVRPCTGTAAWPAPSRRSPSRLRLSDGLSVKRPPRR